MSSLKDRDAVARIVMAHREHVIALGEPPAQRGVSAAWRLSFISRRSCISRTGGSSATSTTRRALRASRRLDREDGTRADQRGGPCCSTFLSEMAGGIGDSRIGREPEQLFTLRIAAAIAWPASHQAIGRRAELCTSGLSLVPPVRGESATSFRLPSGSACRLSR